MSILGKRIAELYGDRILRKSALSIRDGAGVFEQVLGGVPKDQRCKCNETKAADSGGGSGKGGWWQLFK